MDSSSSVEISHQDRTFSFRSVYAEDHILILLQKTKCFYEADVLDCIVSRLSVLGIQSGAAVDVGAYIGTHSVFFGAVIGLNPVISFEPNARVLEALKHNLAANGILGRATVIHKALGSEDGYAQLSHGREDNMGTAAIVRGGKDSSSVEVATLDGELRRRSIDRVALIKIDVEGYEIPVLDGALEALRKFRPLLCIEVHTAKQLLSVLHRVGPLGYRVVDCLGISPTYIMERTYRGRVRTWLANRLWVFRATTAGRSSYTIWLYLKRIADLLSSPPAP